MLEDVGINILVYNTESNVLLAKMLGEHTASMVKVGNVEMEEEARGQ